MNEFVKVKDNNCFYLGGDVQFSQKELTLSISDDGIYYYGSFYKLDYLNGKCNFAPYKEIAVAFGSKPSNVTISNVHLYFDENSYPAYLYQIDERIIFETDFINHPNSVFEKGISFKTWSKTKTNE